MTKPTVSIFGYGKVGTAVAERLWDLGFAIEPVAVGSKESIVETSFGEKMAIIKPKEYINTIINTGLNASFIVVCTPGEVLEEYLNDLLIARKPLIILSTNYDEVYVKTKCEELNISCVMSQNMALPILEMWDIFEKLQNIEFDEEINLLLARESHPGFKKDISGTLIKTLSIFESKGIKNTFDLEKAKALYLKDEDYSYNEVFWNRNPQTQINEYDFIESKFMEAHAYHSYTIEGDNSNDSQCYLQYLYDRLKGLEKYSNKHLQFIINISDNKNMLFITHNINGRSIYGDGVAASIEFLQKNRGVFTGVDVMKSIAK
ncbi:MAG: hypothetical protein U9Q66_01080 [Patescibacteria group bacterium]|nr:hypothetical protein [Patescibacteria group bacterium]